MSRTAIVLCWLSVVANGLLLSTESIADTEAPCSHLPEYSVLDFWIGEWDVFVGDVLAGQNRIERIVGGCAIVEDWRDRDGRPGHSLFYYLPAESAWRQVWVTGRPSTPGGVKEKTLIARLPGGGVVFQGVVALEQGGHYRDRTTLAPSPDGTVRQLIEVSGDEGRSWRTVFDGRYVRRTGGTDDAR